MKFNYNFHEMKTWYEENITNEDIFAVDANIHIWKFNKKINRKKNEGYRGKAERKRESFVIEKISTIRKFIPLSEKYKNIYENNLYIILDYDPNWVIFVYPTIKYNIKGKPFTYLFAEHYSLPFNPDVDPSKKQIQFHETMYIPNNTDQLVIEKGSTVYKDDYFKNDINLSLSTYNDPIFKKYDSTIRESILDMIKFYALEEELSGGMRGISKTSKPPTKKKKYIQKTEDNSSKFSKKWKKYNIDHIFICAIKNAKTNKYGVSVYFHDHQLRMDGETHNGFFFVMDRLSTNFVKEKIINYIMQNNLESSGETGTHPDIN